MPKPGDFFIGVVDLFGIMIPGAIVIYRVDERLFRSLTLVAVVTRHGAEGWEAPLLAALVVLSAYLFVQRRYSRQLTIYQYFMALHATVPSVTKPGTPGRLSPPRVTKASMTPRRTSLRAKWSAA